MRHIYILDDYNNLNVIKTDGASTKVENVYNYLNTKFKSNIERVYVKSWKHHFLKNYFIVRKLLKENIILVILPNDFRLKIFCHIMSSLKNKVHANIFYMVVGGWLPGFLEKNRATLEQCKKFSGIYPETNGMKTMLNSLGLDNVYVSPVFSNQISLLQSDSYFFNKKRIEVCTFSRVDKDKGIDVALQAVAKANETIGYNLFFMNVYGRIMDNSQKEHFEEEFNKNKDICKYHGAISGDKLVETLNKNFLLLFPTFFWGEGFAATLLEGYYSYLPCIATDWKYNSELVLEGETGFLVEPKNVDALAKKLIFCSQNYEYVLNMRKKCLKFASQYTPDLCMEPVLKGIINSLEK